MLDINNIKIGDTIICIEVGYTYLNINKKYIISCIYINNHETDPTKNFVTLIGQRDKFFLYRFKPDLKESRTKKLKQLLNNA